MDIFIGQTAQIIKMALATGDYNKLHIDDDFASKTKFKKRVAHGAFHFAAISEILGTVFPGDGTVYIHQDIDFFEPLFIEDVLIAKVEVIHIKKNIITLKTTCHNQNNKLISYGKSIISVEEVCS